MTPSISINGSVRKWRRYPAYMDTGIKWLNQIPSHWQAKRVEYVCDLFVGFPFPSERFSHEPGGIPLLRGDNVTTDAIRWGEKARFWAHETRKYSRYFLKAEDIVIGMDGSKVGKNYALISESDLPLLLVQRVARLRAGHQILPAFLYRSIANRRFHAHVDYHRTDPAIPHITLKDIGTYMICVPPTDEQHRVVAFIERETAKIEALIAKKERLIELLQEKRMALISHAVTKGLDPDMPMKDSGIEWMGRIPAHWLVCHQKYLWKRCDYGISESLSGTGEIRVLTMGHIRDGEISVPENGCVSKVPPILFLHKNDLLFNRTNSLELVGKVGLYRGEETDEVSFASYLVRLRVNERAEAVYLNYLLNSPGFLRAAQSLALLSINQANLNATRYGSITTAVPPPDEQREIVDVLDGELEKIARFSGKVQSGIEKLREYRTALISAAVTGKINVR